MCRKQKSISAVRKMKNSHSHCKKLYCTANNFTAQQTALQHSKQLYCTAENFTAQQNVLLRNKRFYCTAESFIARRKVSIVAETREKFLLQQEQRISPLCSVFPQTWTQHLRTNRQRQSGTLEPIPRSAKLNFLLRKSLD